MSYHNNKDKTRPYAGFDAAIASIQEEIKVSVPELEKVYHRAYLFREKDTKDRTKKLPKVWEDRKEYVNVLPNDHLKSMLFFYPTGDEVIRDYDEFDSNNNLYERDVCLICWLNTDKLPNHFTGPSISEIKASLLETLSLSDMVIKVNRICDNDAEQIFREFTINDVKTQYLMLPYSGIRIDFTVKFNYVSC